MKVLHTADWHIGQLFHEYDRTNEHQSFLDWLIQVVQVEQIDVLLISGDVFDLSNPAAASIKMFYTFLNQAVKVNPAIHIIITAGNHDSATRLESPKPLLESSQIHIIGLVEKNADGEINYEKMTIPISDKDGNIKIWCLAIPFLRMGDYPIDPDYINPYADGVKALYKEAYIHAVNKKKENQSIIAMGHLHTQKAEITDLDNTERLIMGGVECISADAFHDDIKYVALGHIHKAQRIGGKEHIRYSGSPIPMSFSELNYKHQVTVFDLIEEGVKNLRSIEIPLFIGLKRVPSIHKPLSEVLLELALLPIKNKDHENAPYLEVRVLLDRPEPALRHEIESNLVNKNVRLAKIDVKYPASTDSKVDNTAVAKEELHELQPSDVFSTVYQSKYNNAVPEELFQLFTKAVQEVSQKEE